MKSKSTQNPKPIYILAGTMYKNDNDDGNIDTFDVYHEFDDEDLDKAKQAAFLRMQSYVEGSVHISVSRFAISRKYSFMASLFFFSLCH